MSLTVAYHTGRQDPKFCWFFDSLSKQKGLKRVTQIIIVDFYAQVHEEWTQGDVDARATSVAVAAVRAGFKIENVVYRPPKPTIWQGPYRITKGDHWAASNMRNTSLCLCKNDWIAMLDDRCVLQPLWLQSIRRAMANGYAVFGSYQKRHGMTVERGVIKEFGTVTGVDNREALASGRVVKVNGAWGYGCTLALPVEWALQVNGYPELADGMSFEDILFAMMLSNNGYRMRYDQNMRVIQDRTPTPGDKVFRREDKGISPDDKSHASLERIGGKKRAEHEWDLRAIRWQVLAGQPFPVPTDPNPLDWYDQSPIRGI